MPWLHYIAAELLKTIISRGAVGEERTEDVMAFCSEKQERTEQPVAETWCSARSASGAILAWDRERCRGNSLVWTALLRAAKPLHSTAFRRWGKQLKWGQNIVKEAGTWLLFLGWMPLNTAGGSMAVAKRRSFDSGRGGCCWKLQIMWLQKSRKRSPSPNRFKQIHKAK